MASLEVDGLVIGGVSVSACEICRGADRGIDADNPAIGDLILYITLKGGVYIWLFSISLYTIVSFPVEDNEVTWICIIYCIEKAVEMLYSRCPKEAYTNVHYFNISASVYLV
jgi:hypothetical protein